MKKIYFFLVMLVAANGVWGQTTVFLDDFSTNQSATYTTSGAIGASAWSVLTGGTAGQDFGARRNTSPAQLELTNDATAAANQNGWTFTSTLTSSFSSPYNTTLNLNPGIISWTFNMRQIRTDPAGIGAGSYGVAFVLAGSSTTTLTVGTGYAVTLGQSGTTDPIRLIKYSAGLGTSTNIITSNTVGLTDFGAEYLSIQILYTPSTNTWELLLRNDGASAFADPATGSLTSQGTVVDATYTGSVLTLMGGFWSGSTGAVQTAFFDNTKVTVTSAGTPSIDISSPGIGPTTEFQGATNVVLQRYDLAVTSAPATLNGLTVTTAGTYVAADLTNLKVRYSADAVLDGGDATLSTKTTGLGAGSQVFPSFVSQAILTGTTGYVFVTADIAATAVPGNTINIDPTPFTNISFSGTVNKTGTDPVAAAGVKTFAVLLPDIAISGVSPAAGNINQNSTNNILYAIQLDVTTNNATLNSAGFTTSGTYQVSDLQSSSFKLWINSTNSLAGATQLGTGQTIVASGGSVSFSGLSTVINTGTTRYLLLTTNVAFNAVAGNTVSISSTPFSSIIFASGNKTGTDPVASGNDQTITAVTPLVTITQTGPTASSVANGSTNVFLYQWTAAVTANTAVLNSVTFPTAGTYSVSDLVSNSFKLWYNSANNFGTATLLGSAAIVATGNSVSFSGLTQLILTGSTGFFWLTVDVDANATNGNTINIASTPFTNIVFATATLSGTDPMAAGGVKTIVVVPAAGEVVINQFNPAYSGASDEYVELVNKTNKTFDLSALRISYQSAGGVSGGAGGILTGTLLPYSYWLLSPNATVSVGLTSALPRDGAITAGFAGAAGQFALQVVSTNAIIDALGYGTITGGTFTEGTAAAAPSSNSGYKRNESDDTNDNSADFSSVAVAAIDLRNNSSRLALTGSSIASGTYTRLIVKGNSTASGNITLTGRVELLNGTLTLGSNNLITPQVTGGSSTSYVKTDGAGVFTVNAIGAGPVSMPVGNSTYNPLSFTNGSGLNWSVRVEDAVNNVVVPFNTDLAVNRTWHISPSATVITGPDVTFNFDDADDNQLANPVAYSANSDRNAQVWHYTGTEWIAASGYLSMTAPEGPQSLTMSGFTYFSPFAISKSAGPLPVKFANVRAYQQGSNIRIDWTNLTETNVLNYVVERSADGISFTAISTTGAVRNDGSRADYTSLDMSPLNGINFYRIHSNELDGRSLYSVIVKVNTKGGAAGIVIYPNPVSGGQVSLQTTGLNKGEYTIRIFNANGQQVYNQLLNHHGGAATEVIQLPAALKPGMYTLQLSGGEVKLAKSFIIR